jgi:hypothetical protein
MKIAFLLKGYYRLDNNKQKGRRFTFTGKEMQYHFINDVMDNFNKYIYIPLNSKYDCDWYFVTYEDIDALTFKNNLIETMPKFNVIYLQQNTDTTSVKTFYAGVTHINNIKKYDRYIFARNDLLYKKSIDTFLPQYCLEEYFYYLFKELTYDDDRISDNIFIVDNNVELFISILKECLTNNNIKESQFNLHNVYPIIKKYFKNISPIINGCYNNDTAYNYPLSNNPIYKFAKRPYYFND